MDFVVVSSWFAGLDSPQFLVVPWCRTLAFIYIGNELCEKLIIFTVSGLGLVTVLSWFAVVHSPRGAGHSRLLIWKIISTC